MDLPDNPSKEEIDNELAFTQILLGSLEPDAMDYEATKRKLENDMEVLENMLGNLQDDRNTGADGGLTHAGGSSNTSNSTMNPPPTSTRTPHHQNQLNPPSSSTHPSASSSSSLAATNNMSRKRPFDSATSPYRLGADGGKKLSKSARTTPSPAPSTPASDSDDSLEFLGFLNNKNPSINPALMQQRLQRQRETEDRLFQQAKQRKQDEEVARQLEKGMPVRPPAASQNSSQAILNRNGSFRVPKQEPSSSSRQPAAQPFGLGGPSSQPFDAFGQQPVQRIAYRMPSHGAVNTVNPPDLLTPNAQRRTIKPEPSIKAKTSIRPQQSSNAWAPSAASLRPQVDDTDSSDLEEITPDTWAQSASKRMSADDYVAKQQRAANNSSMPGGFPGVYHSNPVAGPSNPANGYAGYPAYQNGVPAGYAPAATSYMQQGLDKIRDFVNNGRIFGSDTLNTILTPGRHAPMNAYEALRYPGVANPGSNVPFNPDNPYITIDDDDDDDSAYARRYNYVYLTQEQQEQELQKLIDNIRPDEEIHPAMREPTPEALKHELYPHQRLALTWMKNMEEGDNRGGILADDMGLGKTIEALALMVSRPSQSPRRKTTLIIAPVALMRQWAAEIQTKLNGGRHALSVHIHHGAAKKKLFRDLSAYDVVLTTFGTLAIELKRLENWKRILAADPDALPGPRETLSLLGDECKWYRVIIDEAQCIKNRNTQSSKAVWELDAIHRWCMTGTPMMNGTQDLYALVRFLRIGPFNDWSRFSREFILPMAKSVSPERREAAMRKLQALIKAILLRRTKDSEIDGKPILQLPKRTVVVKHVIFSDDEKNFYDGLEQKTQVTINRYLREGTVMRHYSNVLVLLLRLRQACCHPHLIKDYAHATNISDIPEDQRIALAKKLNDEVVKRIIEAGGEFECPICYDGVQNPAIMFPCGHDTCTECFAKITAPDQAIANGDETGQAKCPQCRKPADVNKVIDYDTFKKVHEPEKWAAEHPDEGTQQDEDDETDSETDSEIDDDKTESESDSLNGFIVEDDIETDSDDDEPKPSKKGKEKAKPKSKQKKRSKSKGKGKAKVAPTMTLAELKKLSLRNKKAKQRYLRRLEKDWITSAKIDKALELLREIEENDPTDKTIIFSQWTSMLDLLEVPLHREGIICQRYDGSMDATLRADAVEAFMTQSKCKVMLVSLKAGNAGLNLTAASEVIILDPFWNPYVEDQAIDRAHRIGQRKDVHVHRILVQETVEDRIIQLQEQKREIVGAALDENASKDLGRLGVNQIRFLFGLGGSATATG